MIFCAKNEAGVPTWQLALNHKKTITRRLKPLPVGKEFAICPGRGKFAVCRARVISCMNSLDHFHKYAYNQELYKTINDYKQDEASYEGFDSWDGLRRFFQKINFVDTFRIEFELIN